MSLISPSLSFFSSTATADPLTVSSRRRFSAYLDVTFPIAPSSPPALAAASEPCAVRARHARSLSRAEIIGDRP